MYSSSVLQTKSFSICSMFVSGVANIVVHTQSVSANAIRFVPGGETTVYGAETSLKPSSVSSRIVPDERILSCSNLWTAPVRTCPAKIVSSLAYTPGLKMCRTGSDTCGIPSIILSAAKTSSILYLGVGCVVDRPADKVERLSCDTGEFELDCCS